VKTHEIVRLTFNRSLFIRASVGNQRTALIAEMTLYLENGASYTYSLTNNASGARCSYTPLLLYLRRDTSLSF
jgi:hypothetical protein